MSEVSHCWTKMPAFPLAPCLHPPFASHPVVLFVWSEPRDFGAMPSCTATSPAHRPSRGCWVHPWQQPSSCSTRKGSCPKSVPQFISAILAVNARGRAQSLRCINRAAELSVGNASKSSFPADYFVLESLCRISAQLFVLGIKKKKKIVSEPHPILPSAEQGLSELPQPPPLQHPSGHGYVVLCLWDPSSQSLDGDCCFWPSPLYPVRWPWAYLCPNALPKKGNRDKFSSYSTEIKIRITMV